MINSPGLETGYTLLILCFLLTLSVGIIVLIFTYIPVLYGIILEKNIREPNHLHRFKKSFIIFWICYNSRPYHKNVNKI